MSSRWPDGSRARFTAEARAAMNPPTGRGALREPTGGADRVYTITNTEDNLNDVILNETGERWGCYWLKPVEGDR